MTVEDPSSNGREPGDHAQERKPAKLACAECRRSKLKCDRIFPCQSCVRRGCAAICPDGMLAATKGNKVLMAQAERLGERVKAQAARIEELEKALRNSSDSNTSLHSVEIESELIKELSEDVNELTSVVGSMAIGSSGQINFHGENATSEMLHDLLDAEDEGVDSQYSPPGGQQHSGLPTEMLELAVAFPFGLDEQPSHPKSIFTPFLPPEEYALELVDSYYQYGAWMWEPIARSDTVKLILNPIYGAHGPPDVDAIHPHNLALLFCMFAFATVCKSHPEPSVLANQYYLLSKAAIAFIPMDEETTIATVQTFFVMNRFLFQRDRGKKGNQRRWLMTGMNVRLAQSIGLHRDGTAWSLDEEEVQRRRLLYWELYIHDRWVSINSGRPPSLDVVHTDCRFPRDRHAHPLPSGDIEQSWHAWKHRYAAGFLTQTMKFMFSTRKPSYADLLEFDKRIRALKVPSHLQCPVHAPEGHERRWSNDPYIALQQAMVLWSIEQNLLLIHRSWFAQAIRQAPTNPLEHQYGASVLAVIRSSLKMITGIRGLYALHPERVNMVWLFWSGVYSSCIALGALVLECPASPLARNTLHELDEAIKLYDEGSQTCRPAPTMAALKRLQLRAQEAIRNRRTQALASPRSQERHASLEPDEMEILAGQKNVVASARRSSNKNSPSFQSSSSPSMPTAQDYGRMDEWDLDSILGPFSPEFVSDFANQIQPVDDQTMTMDFSSWNGESMYAMDDSFGSSGASSHATPETASDGYARQNLLQEPSMFAAHDSRLSEESGHGDAWGSLMDSMGFSQ